MSDPMIVTPVNDVTDPAPATCGHVWQTIATIQFVEQCTKCAALRLKNGYQMGPDHKFTKA